MHEYNIEKDNLNVVAGDRHKAIIFQCRDNIKETTCVCMCVCVPVVLRLKQGEGFFVFVLACIIYSMCTVLPLLLDAFNIFSILHIKKKNLAYGNVHHGFPLINMSL